jgi:hypothetical protein
MPRKLWQEKGAKKLENSKVFALVELRIPCPLPIPAALFPLFGFKSIEKPV